MDAANKALESIFKMKKSAKDLIEALGLPTSDTFEIMQMMYKDDPRLLQVLQQITQKAQSEIPSDDEARLKELVYQLSEGFLNVEMQDQLATFQTMWERLKTLPLETLRKGFWQGPAVSQGLGFAGSQELLLSIVSVISWIVANYSAMSTTKSSEQILDAIIDEAEARGCPQALSITLAFYVEEHLSND